MGKPTNHQKKEEKIYKKDQTKKNKNKTKRQVPQVRISILTGTAFAVQCSTH